MENELKMMQKKEWAKDLFTRDTLTPAEIAAKVGATEADVNAWIREGNWDTMRVVMRSRRQEQLFMLYDMLDRVNRAGLEALKGDESKPHPDTEKILKLTTAIGKLEADTGIGDMIETMKKFLVFVLRQDHAMGVAINTWADRFIKSRLEEFN